MPTRGSANGGSPSMSDRTDTALPPDYRYTVYASVVGAGMATLWDANARRRDGTFVAGASGDSPQDALAALAKEIITNG